MGTQTKVEQQAKQKEQKSLYPLKQENKGQNSNSENVEQLRLTNSKLKRELGIFEGRLQGTVERYEKEADDLRICLAAAEFKLSHADRRLTKKTSELHEANPEIQTKQLAIQNENLFTNANLNRVSAFYVNTEKVSGLN